MKMETEKLLIMWLALIVRMLIRNGYLSVDEEVTDEEKKLIERLNEMSKKGRATLP